MIYIRWFASNLACLIRFEFEPPRLREALGAAWQLSTPHLPDWAPSNQPTDRISRRWLCLNTRSFCVASDTQHVMLASNLLRPIRFEFDRPQLREALGAAWQLSIHPLPGWAPSNQPTNRISTRWLCLNTRSFLRCLRGCRRVMSQRRSHATRHERPRANWSLIN